MPQSGLLARAELVDGKSSRKEFSKALVLIPLALLVVITDSAINPAIMAV